MNRILNKANFFGVGALGAATIGTGLVFGGLIGHNVWIVSGGAGHYGLVMILAMAYKAVRASNKRFQQKEAQSPETGKSTRVYQLPKSGYVDTTAGFHYFPHPSAIKGIKADPRVLRSHAQHHTLAGVRDLATGTL